MNLHLRVVRTLQYVLIIREFKRFGYKLISHPNILFCSNLGVFYATIDTKSPFYVIKVKIDALISKKNGDTRINKTLESMILDYS